MNTGNAATETTAAAVVPGGVYLCQVDDRVSCGACCGLYNCADASRPRLEALLAARTEEFRQVPRDPDAVSDFQMRMERRDPRPRPYPDFYHCPFLGLIGANGGRPGCLLHPLGEGNAGVDYRGLSFYGGLACRTYFCPSHRSLPPAFKEIVKAVSTDWYTYGLMITEERLLVGFFGEVEKRLDRALTAADILSSPVAREAVREFLQLKLTWPYHASGWHGPGNYIFDDGLYPRPPVDYGHLGVPRPGLDPIFHELSSAFATPADLARAHAIVERIIESICIQSRHGP